MTEVHQNVRVISIRWITLVNYLLLLGSIITAFLAMKPNGLDARLAFSALFSVLMVIAINTTWNRGAS